MQLHSFGYQEFAGKPDEWRVLPFKLADTNLIVGKNASGKTRTLNVINALAKLLRGAVELPEGEWEVEFEHEGHQYVYELKLLNGEVHFEKFSQDMDVKLQRSADGIGTIKAEEQKIAELKFQVPLGTPAVVAKRDLIQHSFLEPLHKWAESLRFYSFGTPMGRQSVAIFQPTGRKPDPTTGDEVVAIFHHGVKEFSDAFEAGVVEDMAKVGYDLKGVRVAPLSNIAFPPGTIPFTASGIAVQERDLVGETSQIAISQGMFRALSIIVHLRYAEFAGVPSTILIDDIGEGLDFERSIALIRLLMERTSAKHVQLIMSTNDRFVMNAVPLESWAVLTRQRNICRVHNYFNAQEKFEEFKLTGLSNFDLFRAELFSDGPTP